MTQDFFQRASERAYGPAKLTAPMIKLIISYRDDSPSSREDQRNALDALPDLLAHIAELEAEISSLKEPGVKP